MLLVKCFMNLSWGVVVAQLVEQSLPTPKIRGSNPVIGKIVSTKYSPNCIIEKTKIEKKRIGMAHLFYMNLSFPIYWD